MALALGLAVIITGQVVPVSAQAATADQISIIRGAPTDDRGGSTADSDSLFELVQPPSPGRNECSLDAKNGPFKPCSFYFQANGLSAGSHTLRVRQYDQNGTLTTDSWQWNVLASPSIAVEPHSYCWIGFDDYVEQQAFLPETFRRGQALYRSYVAGSSDQFAWPNQNAVYYRKDQGREIFNPLTFQDVPNPAWATNPPANTPPIENPTEQDLAIGAIWADRNPHWLNSLTGRVLIGAGSNGQPEPQPAEVGWPDKAANKYASQEGQPFAFPADIDLTATGFDPVALQPKWQVWSPGSSQGNFAAKTQATINENITPCLILHPPVAVLDNGDGTLSATFGWSNLSPWTISATTGGGWQAPNDKGAAKLEGNQVTGLDGLASTPTGMPTGFGANSTGTWTYTFPDPGADPGNAVRWGVGHEQASFYVKQAQILPASKFPNGATPFTHVDPDTTQQSPSRPVGVGAADPVQDPTDYVVAPLPSIPSAGGAVSSSTTYKVTSKVVKPKKGYVKKGKKIHFKSTVRNTGTVDSVNPKLCDRIPKGLKFVSAPGREIFNGRLVCWTTSRQAAGTAVHGTMTLKAKSNAKIGKRTNRVTVKAVNSTTATAKSTFHVGTKKQNKKNKK